MKKSDMAQPPITVGMNITLGEAFILLRVRHAWDQVTAARKAGISIKVLRDLEQDKYDRVTAGDAIALASAYGIFLHIGLISKQPPLSGIRDDSIDENEEKPDDEQ